MARINVSIGRQRLSNKMQPHESGYAASIKKQVDAIKTNLKNTIKAIENVTPAALEYGMKPIFDKSQKLVPVKTGKLKRSGFLEARKTSQGASVNIGYARGGRPHYAVIVHERTDLRHSGNTQAKFLESAVNQHLDEVQPRMIRFIQGRTGLRK